MSENPLWMGADYSEDDDQSQGDAIGANDAIAAGQGEDPDPQTPGTQGEENLSSEETDSDSDFERTVFDVLKLTGQDNCSQGDLWDPHSSYRRDRDDESSEAELPEETEVDFDLDPIIPAIPVTVNYSAYCCLYPIASELDELGAPGEELDIPASDDLSQERQDQFFRRNIPFYSKIGAPDIRNVPSEWDILFLRQELDIPVSELDESQANWTNCQSRSVMCDSNRFKILRNPLTLGGKLGTKS